jgi:hypothetical protein
MTALRLIAETESGIQVSDGAGWRSPYPGEFVAVDGGSNFLELNGETAAVAWWKGLGAGLLLGLGFAAVMLGVAG